MADSASIAININELPDEILRMIFSYFTPHQLCTRVASVCSKWHLLSRDPSLWHTLFLDNRSFISVVKLFRYAPLEKIDHLQISKWSDSSDALIALISEYCPSITQLGIWCSTVCPSKRYLEALAIRCPNLSHFQLVLDSNVTEFASFPTLIDLTIRNIQLKSHEDASVFDNCENLKVLRVKINDTSAPLFNAYFCSFINKQLTTLNNVNVRDKGMPISESSYLALSKCSNLNTLVFHRASQLSDNALVAIAQNLKELHFLSLTFAPLITAAGLLSAFSDKENLCKLKTFTLSQFIAVDDDIVTAIANRFQVQLTSLSISSCLKVTDKGVTRVLAKCSNLEIIYLNDLDELTDASLWMLPKFLPALRELYIRRCQFSPEAINELTETLPKLTVFT